jgi:membrane protease YdiL (CAAX protease family)
MQKSTRAILLFLCLSLGLSASYWTMVWLFPKGTLPEFFQHLLRAICGDFGPAIAGIITAFYKEGIDGLKLILEKLIRFRVGAQNYLLAFAWPLLAAGTAVLSAYFFAGSSLKPAFAFSSRMILVFFMMAIVDGPLGEEIGWRGFLLPELLKKMKPVFAAVIVGCIWWAWHIPLYFADGRSIPWIPYLFNTVALSLIMTWFFLRTRESIFFAIFLHNMSNYAIYLSRQIWPQLQNTQIDNYMFFAVLLLLGIAAFFGLTRQQLRQ